MATRFRLPFEEVGAGISPANGAQLFFFATGTTNDKDVWAESTEDTVLENPVVANQVGRFPAIFIDGSYRVVLQDKNNKQIWQEDLVESEFDPSETFAVSFDSDITINVPTDYATLQLAVDFAALKYSQSGFIIDVVMEASFTPDSGVIVSNGDYSHIRISSIDSEVTVGAGFLVGDTFIGGDNASMPVLNCLINCDSKGTGYQVHNKSSGYVTSGSGCKNTWQDGLAVRYGSICFADDTIWTGAAQNATTSSGIISWASLVSAARADVSNSGFYGAQCAHGGNLNFQGGIANNTGRYGIRGSDGAQIDADGATANNNTVNGVRAFNNCVINFRSATATGNGEENVVSAGASAVDADGAILTGSLGDGALASGASTLSLSGSDLSGAILAGVQSFSSRVNCQSAIVSNAGTTGVIADDASQVNAAAITATGCTLNGISALNGSIINARDATLDDNVQFGANAFYGSTINLHNATVRRAGSRGIYSFSGSTISAENTDARKIDGVDTGGSNADYTCLLGSTINAALGVGGINKVINTLDSDGIIYQ